MDVCVCVRAHAMFVQIAQLTQREQSLGQRLETVCEENAELKDSVSSLCTRLALQEQQSNMQMQQVHNTHTVMILYSQFDCLEFSSLMNKWRFCGHFEPGALTVSAMRRIFKHLK